MEWLKSRGVTLPSILRSKPRHQPLPQSENKSSSSTEMDESEPFIGSSDGHTRRDSHPRHSRWQTILPWALAATFFTTTAVLYFRPLALYRSSGTRLSEFPLAHPTDFKPTRGEIDLEIVTFTGSPVFHENGTFYVPRPGQKQYIGEPSAEIDAAWDELTWGRYFLITEEEAIDAFGEARDEYWNDKVGGYMAGIDMFHALHCLNRLRKSFWPEHYPEPPHRNHVIHREHCIDHIRQFLMCSGDMTLIPTMWSDHIQRNYVESDVPHTCRNFGKLRDWLTRRWGPDRVEETDIKKHAKMVED